jgi:hypothetical protein
MITNYLNSLSPPEKSAALTRLAEISRRNAAGLALHEDQARWMADVARKAIAMGEPIDDEALRELVALEKSLADGTYPEMLV